MKKRLLLGVDEAGRGPLAGPVAVGVVAVPLGFNIRKHFPDAADSKQLSEEKREHIFERMKKLQKLGALSYTVSFSSAQTIDRVGITRAVRAAVFRGVRKLAPVPKGAKVLLDGLLSAPKEYAQKTIIKGDQTETLISLASIAAKVTRDHCMKRLSLVYPEYNFVIHKGYGTKAHYKAIGKHGPCAIHRKSWLVEKIPHKR